MNYKNDASLTLAALVIGCSRAPKNTFATGSYKFALICSAIFFNLQYTDWKTKTSIFSNNTFRLFVKAIGLLFQ